MANRKTRGRKAQKDHSPVRNEENGSSTPKELMEKKVDPRESEGKASASRVCLEHEDSKMKEDLTKQGKTLSEMGINTSRKLDWSAIIEKEKREGSSQGGAESVNKLRKGGIPLEYVEPKKQDGHLIAEVQKLDLQRQVDYWKTSVNKLCSWGQPSLQSHGSLLPSNLETSQH
ncbi:OLC1v1018676C1 [Oldenlandia corymbosa var. corymbosa]|uniref:OLC1v1018676C1 n=1 Tax=Oldenlandia corymbosa var. corymbosa TaxID=529605 RepID=A0AAV1EC43_OLDCO|nr:OLC1v1018676C1 [Oldenlandia corymbosa var. corymbosa]